LLKHVGLVTPEHAFLSLLLSYSSTVFGTCSCGSFCCI